MVIRKAKRASTNAISNTISLRLLRADINKSKKITTSNQRKQTIIEFPTLCKKFRKTAVQIV